MNAPSTRLIPFFFKFLIVFRLISILLDRYQPDCIINTGSASGVHHSLNIGDVVISTEVRHHEVDATAFNYEWGQEPQMPAAYLPDEKLVKAAAVAQICYNYKVPFVIVRALSDIAGKESGISFDNFIHSSATLYKSYYENVTRLEIIEAATTNVILG